MGVSIHLDRKVIDGAVTQQLVALKAVMPTTFNTYRKTFSISRTKSQNLNVSNLILQLYLLSPLTPCVKSRMKM